MQHKCLAAEARLLQFFFSVNFLSLIECNSILLLLTKCQILSYCKCVDDIRSTYSRNTSDIDNILLEINRICAKLIFSAEYEINNSVKFLDVTLTRRPTDIDFLIYRKPATTDCIRAAQWSTN